MVGVANFSDAALDGLLVEVEPASDGGLEVLFGQGSGEMSADGIAVSGLGARAVVVFRL